LDFDIGDVEASGFDMIQLITQFALKGRKSLWLKGYKIGIYAGMDMRLGICQLTKSQM